MFLCRVILSLFIALICFLGSHPAVQAANLPSYRAVYALTLDQALAQSGLVGASGSMTIEWQDVCDGWSAVQHVTINLNDISGNITETDSRFASWESKDGLVFRFDVRNSWDGSLYEQFNGRATLSSQGGPGRVVYSTPEDKILDLPKSTVFPSEHLFLLVDAAKKGEKILSRIVFDGASEEGMSEINAVIGSLTPVETPNAKLDSSLNTKYWPMRLAFFSMKAGVDIPDYETTAHLLENGIAWGLLLDYGNFKIRGTLDKVEFPPKPSC
jgi:hypothetical protein